METREIWYAVVAPPLGTIALFLKKSEADDYLDKISERPEFRNLDVKLVVSVADKTDQFIKFTRLRPGEPVQVAPFRHGR